MKQYLLTLTMPESLQNSIMKQVSESAYADNWGAFDIDYTAESNTGADKFINRGRRHSRVHEFPQLAEEVEAFADMLLSHEDMDRNFISAVPVDYPGYCLSHFISVMYKEGKRGLGIHPHSDPRSEDGRYHLRYNFLASTADGGDPIIDEQLISVGERQGWVCFASETIHRATPVVDDNLRVSLSLGFFIDPEYAHKKYPHLLG
jgi:hypothetical protein